MSLRDWANQTTFYYRTADNTEGTLFGNERLASVGWMVKPLVKLKIGRQVPKARVAWASSVGHEVEALGSNCGASESVEVVSELSESVESFAWSGAAVVFPYSGWSHCCGTRECFPQR